MLSARRKAPHVPHHPLGLTVDGHVVNWWTTEPRLSRAIRVTLIVGWLGPGALLVAGGQVQGWSPLMALKPLPDILETGIGAFLFVGTLLILWGSQHRASLSDRVLREGPGLILVGVAWAAYVACTASVHPDFSWIGSGLIASSFVTGCAIRGWALWGSMRRARALERIGRGE